MTITTEGYDILPLRPQDVERIVRYIPDECVMVGGHVLIFWAEAFGIPFISHTGKTNVTKDMDFYGKEYLIDIIADNWNGRTRLISEIMDTSLIGQVIKKADDGYGYRVVDVLKKVFALKEEIFIKRAVKVPYHGHSLRVLHPIDLLKARVENVYGIKKKHTQHNADQMGLAIDKARIINVAEIENKQTQHHADQIDLAITIANTYLNLRVKQYQRNKDSNILNSVIKDTKELVSYIFDDQLFKTTRYWRLKITDVIPLEALKSIENCSELSDFVNVEWPVIIATTNKMRLTKKISELSDKFKNKYKP